jgi:hypothetical protein
VLIITATSVKIMSSCNHEKMNERYTVCACNRYFVSNIVHHNLREI